MDENEKLRPIEINPLERNREQKPMEQKPMEQNPMEQQEQNQEHQVEKLQEQSCLLFNRFCLKFCSQIAILSVCVVFSLIELTKEETKNKELWSSLLSFCIGIIVEAPENKKR